MGEQELSLLSGQGLLGNYAGMTDFLKHNNALLPLGAFLLLMGPGRSFLRMGGMGILPILFLSMLATGKPLADAGLLGEAGSTDDGSTVSGASFFSYITQQGWLMPALVLCGLLMFARGALFSLQGLLPIVAIVYLLGSRDYSVNSLMKGGQLTNGFILAGAAALLMWLRRRYVVSSYYGRPVFPFGSMGPVMPGSLTRLAGQVALAAAFAFAGLMIFNPDFLEENFPDWRTTWGAAAFCAAGYGFMISMPPKFRQWAMPVFWGLICLIIGAGVYNGISSRDSSFKEETEIDGMVTF